jgi:hypothetical protein
VQLGAYVLDARTTNDPASWTRLTAYILDADRASEKVAWSRVTNCQSDDPGWAVIKDSRRLCRNCCDLVLSDHADGFSQKQTRIGGIEMARSAQAGRRCRL